MGRPSAQITSSTSSSSSSSTLPSLLLSFWLFLVVFPMDTTRNGTGDRVLSSCTGFLLYRVWRFYIDWTREQRCRIGFLICIAPRWFADETDNGDLEFRLLVFEFRVSSIVIIIKTIIKTKFICLNKAHLNIEWLIFKFHSIAVASAFETISWYK